MGRAPCCDKSKVKKGPWSVEEDTLLSNFITRYGNGGNWITLPKKAGLNRCGKSCRLRWLNYLRPDIKHGAFTEEEDHTIYTLYKTIGSRWSVIAAKLQGRTDNDVKNYWNTKLKKKVLAGNIVNATTTSSTSNYYNNMKLTNYDMDSNNYIHDTIQVQKVGMELDRFPFQPRYGDGIKENMGEFGHQKLTDGCNMNRITLLTACDEEVGFWTDMLFESLDDGVVGSQLEDKINEIASLLGDPKFHVKSF